MNPLYIGSALSTPSPLTRNWSAVVGGIRNDSTAQQPTVTNPTITIADPRDAEIAALKAALAASNVRNAELEAQLLARPTIDPETERRKAFAEVAKQAAAVAAKVIPLRAMNGNLLFLLQQGNYNFAQVCIWNYEWQNFFCNHDAYISDLKVQMRDLRTALSYSDNLIYEYEEERDQYFGRLLPLCYDLLNSIASGTIDQVILKKFKLKVNEILDIVKADEDRVRETALTAPAIVVPVATPVLEPVSSVGTDVRESTLVNSVSEVYGVPVSELPKWITHAREYISALLISLGMPVSDLSQYDLSQLDYIIAKIWDLRDAINTPLPDDDESAVEAVIPSDGYPSSKEITDLILAHIDENKRKVEACQRNTPKDERKPMHHAIFDTRLMQEYVRSLSRNDQILLPGKVMKFIEQNCKPRHSAQEAGAYRKAKAKANSIKPSPPSPPTHLVSPVSPVTSMPNISIAIPGTWPMKFKEVSTIPSSTPDTASAAAGGSA